MKRSSSTSHIPLPKNEARSRPRSTARSSKESALPSFKRSNSLASLRKLGTTPLRTPLQNLKPRSISTNRAFGTNSLGTTPSSTRGRSPFSIKKERPVSDKQWVSNEYKKIQQYLREHPHCDQNIVDRMRPPTIDTFVYIASLLLKDIDERINVNKANYKEVIFGQMKALRFPGNISNSLLKTVNAMHAWPQVISMFAWLIDLSLQLNTINAPTPTNSSPHMCMAEALQDYLSHKYLIFNNVEDTSEIDEALKVKLGDILGIDANKIETLRTKIISLEADYNQKNTVLSEKQEEYAAKEQEVKTLQSEIDHFLNEDTKRDEQSAKELKNLKSKIESLKQSLKSTMEHTCDLKAVLQTQSCSYSEKKKILKHIEELKHTLNLKKEKIEKWKQIKDKYDFELGTGKKIVENEIYRLNSSLMPLQLVFSNVKELRLPDKGFLAGDYIAVIKKVSETFASIDKEVNKELVKRNNELLKAEKNIDDIEKVIQARETDCEKLDTKKFELQLVINSHIKKIETCVKESERLKTIQLQKIAEIDKIDVDIDGLKAECCELKSKKTKMLKDLDKLEADCLEFLCKLREAVLQNLEEMNEIRLRIIDKVSETLEKVFETEGNILKSLREKFDDFKSQ